MLSAKNVKVYILS